MTREGTPERSVREAIVEAGRLLHERGLLAGTAGNLSARLPDGRVVVTPRGVRKDALATGDLVVLDPASPDPDALERATTEWPLHAALYAADAPTSTGPTSGGVEREERGTGPVGAVVHTHAPALTALGLGAADGAVRLARALPEVAEAVGGVATVPFAPSGSRKLAEATASAHGGGAAVLLLARHGAVASGPSVDVAVDRMELAELSARAVLLAG